MSRIYLILWAFQGSVVLYRITCKGLSHHYIFLLLRSLKNLIGTSPAGNALVTQTP